MATVTTISGEGIVSKETLKEVELGTSKNELVLQRANEIDSTIASNQDTSASEPSPEKSKYAGDILDDTPLLHSKYKLLPFQLSAQVAATFYDAIREQQVVDGIVQSLHPWQLDISRELCIPANKPTSQHPLKYALVASNGSGKDQFVIAPFSIWFIASKIRSRVILTSSSGTQLTSQTENYIKDLANRMNEVFGEEVFRVRQRYIKCRWTGSEIRMFATDEEGKAEGYHPLDPNAEMCIIVNEAKTVTEEIHKALKRCTGFNYWLEVSSPGEPKGFLHHAFTAWPLTRRVTSYDCPHISISEIEDDKSLYGEHSAYFRSKHLALFTSMGGNTLIPIEIVDRLLQNPPELCFVGSKWIKRVGIDLSAGGDELCICITQGNSVFAEEVWKERDTTVSADKIVSYLLKQGISKTHEYIFADDGGVGHAIIDMLVRKGWTIKRIHNQSPAINKRHYGNRGAEAYDRVKRLFEESIFNPIGMSGKCINQLCNRKVKDKLEGAKVFLQSKKDAKAHGFESPDRADAFILSLTGLTIEDFLQDTSAVKLPGDKPRIATVRLTTPEEVYQWWQDNETYGEGKKYNATTNKRNFGSLRQAIESGDGDSFDQYNFKHS